MKTAMHRGEITIIEVNKKEGWFRMFSDKGATLKVFYPVKHISFIDQSPLIINSLFLSVQEISKRERKIWNEKEWKVRNYGKI